MALSFALVAGALGGTDRPALAQAAPAVDPSAAVAPPVAVAPADPPAAVAPADQPAAIAPVAPAVTAPIIPAPAATPPPAAGQTPSPVPAVTPVVTTPPPDAAPAIHNPPLPPVKAEKAEKKNTLAARDLFASKKLPSLGQAMAIGYYPRGCLSGGVELPVNGATWQVMRLSRNRNWGHPSLVRFVEKFAAKAAKATGWNGIMVGDLAQPRGGPTPTGHMSHQTGLDVDIWFMPMPDHRLSRQERDSISAINVVASDWKQLNPKFWTPQHVAFIRTAVEQPEVERVLVNAVIKKELCRVTGKSASWMKKVRPWYGHHDHIHVRLRCPDGSNNCRHQPSVPGDEGCGKSLDFWFSDKVLKPKKRFAVKKPLTLADLPAACKTVLGAPARAARAARD
jgi:penicillin-insensitive murein endopeptidase